MSWLNLVKILVLTLALAGAASWLRASRPQAQPDPRLAAVPAPGIPLIRVDEAKALWRDQRALFVDVRSATDYAYGHISGAVSLPFEEMDKLFLEWKPRLEQAEVLVIYCKNVDCGKSLWAAQELWNAGFKQVRIYPGGWNEWSDRGLPRHATATR